MTHPKLIPTSVRFGGLSHYCEILRLSDIVDLGSHAPHEELRRARLGNAATWWNNQAAVRMGYHPQDNSESFRQEAERTPRNGDVNDGETRHQGGFMLTQGIA